MCRWNDSAHREQGVLSLLMAGEADAEPTELAGVAEMGTEAAEAWSLDDADEDYPLTGSWDDPERRLTPRRMTVLAVAASVVAVGAVAGFGVWKLRDQHREPDKLVVVVATTTTVKPVAAPPPKPSARVVPTSAAQMSPPPPPLPEVHLTALDYLFLQKVRAAGFTGSVDDLIRGAAKVCYDLQHGKDLPEISQDMATTNDLTPDQAHWFASEVLLTYPTCHG